VVPRADEVMTQLASGGFGAEGIGRGSPTEGAEGTGRVGTGPDDADGGRGGAGVDGDRVGLVTGGPEGISPIGSTCDCIDADGTRADPRYSKTVLVLIVYKSRSTH
jgi:hypothetical protein